MKTPVDRGSTGVSYLVANQETPGFLNSLINQQLAILAGRFANEKVTHLVSHVRPQTASEGT